MEIHPDDNISVLMGDPKTMRLADLTRRVTKNKRTGKRIGPPMSCGCLKFEAYQRFRQSRKRTGPMLVARKWIPSRFWEDLSEAGLGCPLLICLRALQKGGFRPAIAMQLTSQLAEAA